MFNPALLQWNTIEMHCLPLRALPDIDLWVACFKAYNSNEDYFTLFPHSCHVSSSHVCFWVFIDQRGPKCLVMPFDCVPEQNGWLMICLALKWYWPRALSMGWKRVRGGSSFNFTDSCLSQCCCCCRPFKDPRPLMALRLNANVKVIDPL